MSHWSPRHTRLVTVVGVTSLLALAFATVPNAAAAAAPVGLGGATSFAVLAGSTVTNTGPSVISGNVGLSPGTDVPGFPPGIINNGVLHSTDAVAAQAQLDLATAYDDASSRSTTGLISADLAGQTLVGGVYTGGALGLSGALVLDAQGDSTTVFVFQAATTLITASASSVTLVNGADPCNVYWQVGTSATIGTASQFVGTVLALASVSAQTGATVSGRLLARNGAVTLDTNVVTRPNCPALAPTPTTAAAAPNTTSAAPTTIAPIPPGTTDIATATLPGIPTTVGPSSETLPPTGARVGATSAVGFLALLAGGSAILVLHRRPRQAQRGE